MARDEQGIRHTDDGVCLTSIAHPPDFPWAFVHKLVNVQKRKVEAAQGKAAINGHAASTR